MSLKVSIIIPSYNRGKVIKETLDSVYRQAYTDWECIVVDDGSTDNTCDIVKFYTEKDSRFKLYSRPNNRRKGANACRNYGFEKATGTFIQWFDSDDIMHPNKLEKKVNILSTSNYDFVVCSGIEFKESIDNNFSKWNKTKSKKPALDHIIGNMTLHTNGPLFKREIIARSKLFNESLMRKQEWEYYTRLLFQTQNYFALDDILYYFRIHNNSINGRNTIGSLKSKIKANRLVFKNVKSNEGFLLENSFLRKHFFNKYIEFFKSSIKNKMYNSSLKVLYGIFECISFKMFLKSISNILKKPSNFFNLFKQ